MSKEYIQALDGLFGLVSFQKSLTREQFTRTQKYFDIIESALQRLESIDNSNPSEALEYLEQFLNEMTYCLEHPKEYAKGYEKQIFWKYKNTLETTIKQALIKAEKEHNSLNLLMQELDCKDFETLRKHARCGYEKLKSQEKEVEE